MKTAKTFLILAVNSGLAGLVEATTYYVSPGQSIQAAIDGASDTDQIEVAPGTYTEVIDFLGKAVRLYSSGEPNTRVGTIGQPDAQISSGGDYVLNGGYWAGTCGCIVNLTDLSNFVQQWLFEGPGLKADLYADQKVDLEDFTELAWWWMQNCPPDWPLK